MDTKSKKIRELHKRLPITEFKGKLAYKIVNSKETDELN